MSEELNTMAGQDSLDEFSGVDGDGLGEGEVASEGELSWRFSPLGVLEE